MDGQGGRDPGRDPSDAPYGSAQRFMEAYQAFMQQASSMPGGHPSTVLHPAFAASSALTESQRSAMALNMMASGMTPVANPFWPSASMNLQKISEAMSSGDSKKTSESINESMAAQAYQAALGLYPPMSYPAMWPAMYPAQQLTQAVSPTGRDSRKTNSHKKRESASKLSPGGGSGSSSKKKEKSCSSTPSVPTTPSSSQSIMEPQALDLSAKSPPGQPSHVSNSISPALTVSTGSPSSKDGPLSPRLVSPRMKSPKVGGLGMLDRIAQKLQAKAEASQGKGCTESTLSTKQLDHSEKGTDGSSSMAKPADLGNQDVGTSTAKPISLSLKSQESAQMFPNSTEVISEKVDSDDKESSSNLLLSGPEKLTAEHVKDSNLENYSDTTMKSGCEDGDDTTMKSGCEDGDKEKTDIPEVSKSTPEQSKLLSDAHEQSKVSTDAPLHSELTKDAHEQTEVFDDSGTQNLMSEGINHTKDSLEGLDAKDMTSLATGSEVKSKPKQLGGKGKRVKKKGKREGVRVTRRSLRSQEHAPEPVPEPLLEPVPEPVPEPVMDSMEQGERQPTLALTPPRALDVAPSPDLGSNSHSPVGSRGSSPVKSVDFSRSLALDLLESLTGESKACEPCLNQTGPCQDGGGHCSASKEWAADTTKENTLEFTKEDSGEGEKEPSSEKPPPEVLKGRRAGVGKKRRGRPPGRPNKPTTPGKPKLRNLVSQVALPNKKQVALRNKKQLGKKKQAIVKKQVVGRATRASKDTEITPPEGRRSLRTTRTAVDYSEAPPLFLEDYIEENCLTPELLLTPEKDPPTPGLAEEVVELKKRRGRSLRTKDAAMLESDTRSVSSSCVEDVETGKEVDVAVKRRILPRRCMKSVDAATTQEAALPEQAAVEVGINGKDQDAPAAMSEDEDVPLSSLKSRINHIKVDAPVQQLRRGRSRNPAPVPVLPASTPNKPDAASPVEPPEPVEAKDTEPSNLPKVVKKPTVKSKKGKKGAKKKVTNLIGADIPTKPEVDSGSSVDVLSSNPPVAVISSQAAGVKPVAKRCRKQALPRPPTRLTRSSLQEAARETKAVESAKQMVPTLDPGGDVPVCNNDITDTSPGEDADPIPSLKENSTDSQVDLEPLKATRANGGLEHSVKKKKKKKTKKKLVSVAYCDKPEAVQNEGGEDLAPFHKDQATMAKHCGSTLNGVLPDLRFPLSKAQNNSEINKVDLDVLAGNNHCAGASLSSDPKTAVADPNTFSGKLDAIIAKSCQVANLGETMQQDGIKVKKKKKKKKEIDPITGEKIKKKKKKGKDKGLSVENSTIPFGNHAFKTEQVNEIDEVGGTTPALQGADVVESKPVPGTENLAASQSVNPVGRPSGSSASVLPSGESTPAIKPLVGTVDTNMLANLQQSTAFLQQALGDQDLVEGKKHTPHDVSVYDFDDGDDMSKLSSSTSPKPNKKAAKNKAAKTKRFLGAEAGASSSYPHPTHPAHPGHPAHNAYPQVPGMRPWNLGAPSQPHQLPASVSNDLNLSDGLSFSSFYNFNESSSGAVSSSQTFSDAISAITSSQNLCDNAFSLGDSTFSPSPSPASSQPATTVSTAPPHSPSVNTNAGGVCLTSLDAKPDPLRKSSQSLHCTTPSRSPAHSQSSGLSTYMRSPSHSQSSGRGTPHSDMSCSSSPRLRPVISGLLRAPAPEPVMSMADAITIQRQENQYLQHLQKLQATGAVTAEEIQRLKQQAVRDGHLNPEALGSESERSIEKVSNTSNENAGVNIPSATAGTSSVTASSSVAASSSVTSASVSSSVSSLATCSSTSSVSVCSMVMTPSISSASVSQPSSAPATNHSGATASRLTADNGISRDAFHDNQPFSGLEKGRPAPSSPDPQPAHDKLNAVDPLLPTPFLTPEKSLPGSISKPSPGPGLPPALYNTPDKLARPASLPQTPQTPMTPQTPDTLDSSQDSSLPATPLSWMSQMTSRSSLSGTPVKVEDVKCDLQEKLNKLSASQPSSEGLSLVTENGHMNMDYMAGPVKDMLHSKEEDLTERLRANMPEEIPKCDCLGGAHFDERLEGPYYTHLGAARDVPAIRKLMEERSGVTGNALRIEKVLYTGKEGKSEQGCPIAKWIIRRSGPEEKLLVVTRMRNGHHCEHAIIVIGICVWEGVPQERANHLYNYLCKTLPPYGFETERRCGTNEQKTCACQGWNGEVGGASFSFGCSWSMYYNGCKFARSHVPRKFRLKAEPEEPPLEDELQNLATEISPLYKQIAPDSYRNMCEYEETAVACRLGKKPGRPWAGVTACVDFCAHSHKDIHNMNNGCTTVVTLTKHRGFGRPDDEQLHVLPLCVLDPTDENGTHEGQYKKIKCGALDVLSRYSQQMRVRATPLLSKKKRRLLAKGLNPGPCKRGRKPGSTNKATAQPGIKKTYRTTDGKTVSYRIMPNGKCVKMRSNANKKQRTEEYVRPLEPAWPMPNFPQLPYPNMRHPHQGMMQYPRGNMIHPQMRHMMPPYHPGQRPYGRPGFPNNELNNWFSRWASAMDRNQMDPQAYAKAMKDRAMHQQRPPTYEEAMGGGQQGPPHMPPMSPHGSTGSLREHAVGESSWKRLDNWVKFGQERAGEDFSRHRPSSASSMPAPSPTGSSGQGWPSSMSPRSGSQTPNWSHSTGPASPRGPTGHPQAMWGQKHGWQGPRPPMAGGQPHRPAGHQWGESMQQPGQQWPGAGPRGNLWRPDMHGKSPAPGLSPNKLPNPGLRQACPQGNPMQGMESSEQMQVHPQSTPIPGAASLPTSAVAPANHMNNSLSGPNNQNSNTFPTDSQNGGQTTDVSDNSQELEKLLDESLDHLTGVANQSANLMHSVVNESLPGAPEWSNRAHVPAPSHAQSTLDARNPFDTDPKPAGQTWGGNQWAAGKGPKPKPGGWPGMPSSSGMLSPGSTRNTQFPGPRGHPASFGGPGVPNRHVVPNNPPMDAAMHGGPMEVPLRASVGHRFPPSQATHGSHMGRNPAALSPGSHGQMASHTGSWNAPGNHHTSVADSMHPAGSQSQGFTYPSTATNAGASRSDSAIPNPPSCHANPMGPVPNGHLNHPANAQHITSQPGASERTYPGQGPNSNQLHSQDFSGPHSQSGNVGVHGQHLVGEHNSRHLPQHASAKHPYQNSVPNSQSPQAHMSGNCQQAGNQMQMNQGQVFPNQSHGPSGFGNHGRTESSMHLNQHHEPFAGQQHPSQTPQGQMHLARHGFPDMAGSQPHRPPSNMSAMSDHSQNYEGLPPGSTRPNPASCNMNSGHRGPPGPGGMNPAQGMLPLSSGMNHGQGMPPGPGGMNPGQGGHPGPGGMNHGHRGHPRPGGMHPGHGMPSGPGGVNPGQGMPSGPGGITHRMPTGPGGVNPGQGMPPGPVGINPGQGMLSGPGGMNPGPGMSSGPGGMNPGQGIPTGPGGMNPGPGMPSGPGGMNPGPGMSSGPGGMNPGQGMPSGPGGMNPGQGMPSGPGGMNPGQGMPSGPGGMNPGQGMPSGRGGMNPGQGMSSVPGGMNPGPGMPSGPSGMNPGPGMHSGPGAMNPGQGMPQGPGGMNPGQGMSQGPGDMNSGHRMHQGPGGMPSGPCGMSPAQGLPSGPSRVNPGQGMATGPDGTEPGQGGPGGVNPGQAMPPGAGGVNPGQAIPPGAGGANPGHTMPPGAGGVNPGHTMPPGAGGANPGQAMPPGAGGLKPGQAMPPDARGTNSAQEDLSGQGDVNPGEEKTAGPGGMNPGQGAPPVADGRSPSQVPPKPDSIDSGQGVPSGPSDINHSQGVPQGPGIMNPGQGPHLESGIINSGPPGPSGRNPAEGVNAGHPTVSTKQGAPSGSAGPGTAGPGPAGPGPAGPGPGPAGLNVGQGPLPGLQGMNPGLTNPGQVNSTEPIPEEPKPKEIATDNQHIFADPDIGGVAIALSHGSVLFEVAKRELHATTAMKKPNRYEPTRISLVFYQHKAMNMKQHGAEEYERKCVIWAKRREERDRQRLLKEQEAANLLPPPLPEIRKRKYPWDQDEHADIRKKYKVTPKVQLMWDTHINHSFSSTTNTISTKWVQPRSAIVGPYQGWR